MSDESITEEMSERHAITNETAFATYTILRLCRWRQYVRWIANDVTLHPGPREIESWWGPMILDGNVEQLGFVSMKGVCPVDAPEALETWRCVGALPTHLRDTVWQEYVTSGKRAEKAASLGIEPEAFRRRINQAHVLLLGLFNDAAAGLLE